MQVYADIGTRLPIFSWASVLENEALQQARNLANHPRCIDHIALMPDCHTGYGMPIGGVVAMDAICPNAVGNDIGCGMTVGLVHGITNTDLSRSLREHIADLIEASIPLGKNHHIDSHPDWMPARVDREVVEREWGSATHQIGTLGSGNHFIEVQRCISTGAVYVMIHSGSRNIGLKIAQHYIKKANEYVTSIGEEYLFKQDLAYLPIDSDAGRAYIEEMNFALSFAYENRRRMMMILASIFDNVLGVELKEVQNIHHNYAALEDGLWIHRKGATRAQLGEVCIIPGAMGRSSFICSGMGNDKSFSSCSHGAGRTMGRNEAKRTLDLEEQMAILDEQDIVHRMKSIDKLDEAPGAYKSIVNVMSDQKDLVDAFIELRGTVIVKG